LRFPLPGRGRGRTVIEALVEIATKLAPSVLSELVHLARLALARAPEDEIVASAKKLAVLAAFKASYRRRGK
jgi:hypothetical protein